MVRVEERGQKQSWKFLQTPRPNVIANLHSPVRSPEVILLTARGGGYLTKFCTGRLRPEVQPFTLSYTILAEKVPLLYTFY